MAEITAGEAARILEAERRHQMQECQRAIQATLQKHGCRLIAVPQITPDGKVVAQVVLQPLPLAAGQLEDQVVER